jgi:hypothetical protein
MKKSTKVSQPNRAAMTAQAKLAARLAAVVGAEPRENDGREGMYVVLPYQDRTNGCFVVSPQSIRLDVMLTLEQGEAAIRAIGRRRRATGRRD